MLLMALLLAQENIVDRHLGDAAPAEDHVFLRRASLDIAGELPDPDAVRAFLADASADKRARRVDELAASEAFAKFWARRLTAAWIGYPTGDLQLLVDHEGFEKWLRERLAANASYEEAAREALTASGLTQNRPEASFVNQFAYANDQGEYGVRIDDLTAKVGSTFLGYRLRCAQCHDHPFDRWTQEDFYGLAAFFRRTGISRAGLGVTDKPKAVTYAFESWKGPLEPRYLDGGKPEGDALRADLARLMAKDRQFARAFVNRAWAWFFGRGLVDPYDDFAARRRGSPLLEDLAGDFERGGYDLRRLAREIARSRAYQGRGAALRPLAPEQLYGAIASATLLEEARVDARDVKRLAGPVEPYKPPRVRLRAWFVAMIARTSEAGSPAALHTYTANTQQVLRTLSPASLIYTGARAKGEGRLDRAMAGREPDGVVRELYLAALSRPPSERETARALARAGAKDGAPEAFERIFWALLNCDEFIFNH